MRHILLVASLAAGYRKLRRCHEVHVAREAQRFRRFHPAVVLVLVVAGACSSSSGSGSGGGSGFISLANYDTSCQRDDDCVAIETGAVSGCCGCDNSAINTSDHARYLADFAEATTPHQVCNADCVSCPVEMPACRSGTCALVPVSSVCGPATCGNDQVCVVSQIEGGAVRLPDDAGVCPVGTRNNNGRCELLPTYRCAPRPAACGAGLSCDCARSLCDPSYVCESAAAGAIQCDLLAP